MKRAVSFCVVFFFTLFLCDGLSGSGKDYVLYVGTYTQGESKGIYAFDYDADSGKLGARGIAAEAVNPSFLTVDRSQQFLFAVNEVQKYENANTGVVSAFSIDHRTWKLSLLNQVASGGAGPCYIALDKSGKYLLVANYMGGTVAAIPVAADGRLSQASSVIKDSGAVGPVKERQEGPHAHWIENSARNRFAYVADLGLDRVLIYKFDAAKGMLGTGDAAAKGGASSEDFFSATLAPGTGPRHIAFSADGNYMYVLGELDSTVTVFSNDEKEHYKAIQKISALPAGFNGKNGAAEVAVHPSGKFLYTSNRGDDSIAVFSVDRDTGRLTLEQRVPTGGKTPRNFALDPNGSRLLAANQDSGDIEEFTIDAASGKLHDVGEVAKVPSPVCLVFVAKE